MGYKWAGAESNCRHTAFQAVALPTELPALRAKSNFQIPSTNPVPTIKYRNPRQAVKSVVSVIGYWNLELACDLEFVIWDFPLLFLKRQQLPTIRGQDSRTLDLRSHPRKPAHRFTRSMREIYLPDGMKLELSK